jgi:hypothetical protein
MAYSPKTIDTSRIKLPGNILQVVERLAENNHEVWAQQRIADGWSYGVQRDDHRKEHPGLIPYAQLTESEKQYDRRTAEEVVKVILALGFRITKED